MMAFSFVSLFAKAQSENTPNGNTKDATGKAVHTAAIKVVETGKKYKHGNSSNAAGTQRFDEGVISFLNKTIEELEERAERQYRNNSYVIIKED